MVPSLLYTGLHLYIISWSKMCNNERGQPLCLCEFKGSRELQGGLIKGWGLPQMNPWYGIIQSMLWTTSFPFSVCTRIKNTRLIYRTKGNVCIAVCRMCWPYTSAAWTQLSQWGSRHWSLSPPSSPTYLTVPCSTSQLLCYPPFIFFTLRFLLIPNSLP